MAENNITTRISFELEYANVPYFIISNLGVISNVLLLVAYIKDPLKYFRNSGMMLMINLAVSDLLACLLAPSYFRIIVITGWYPLIACIVAFCGGASLISIASISIDRFFMVAYPLKHRYLIKGKIMVLWCAGIWLGTSVFPIMRLVLDQTGMFRITFYCFGEMGIIFSVVMYVSTYSKLKQQSQNMGLQNSTESRALALRILKEKQFLRTIIIITCITFISVTPSMLFFLTREVLSVDLRSGAMPSEIIKTTVTSLFCANFAVNPLIYILRLPNYRKTFYLLYCRRRSSLQTR